MKKPFFTILLIFLAVMFFPLGASAHSGGTDADGGHYDGNKYHYHHGYPAHQHTGGECPYDFHDNTANRNDTSGNKSNYNVSSSDEEDASNSLIIGTIIFSGIGAVYVGYKICQWYKGK